MSDFVKRLDFGIEELLLIFLIVLNVLEFAGLLSLELDYIKKIISWVCLGYLLYEANLTEIFYGYKDKFVDGLLILAYFSLIFNDFVRFTADSLAQVSALSDSFLVPTYVFITQNAPVITLYSIYLGIGLLFIAACFNLFMNSEIREPSIMAIFHKSGPATTITTRVTRSFSAFVLTLAFFFIVFKMIIEWLGWVVDSSILVLAIFFYFFFIIKRAKQFSAENMVFKLGDVGIEFYSKFISLFHSRNTIILGFSGMLVLHLLTGLGVFIIPYILGKQISYFGSLGEGHTLLLPLLQSDLASAVTLLQSISVVLVYLMNVLAILFILLAPAYIWYDLYKNRFLSSRKWLNGLYFSAVAVFLMNPLFTISKIAINGVAGADIQTMPINVSLSLFSLGVAILVFLLIFVLSFNHALKRIIKYIFIITANVFFGYYLYFFSTSVIQAHLQSIVTLGLGSPLISLFLFFSLIILTLFYIFGFAGFLSQSMRMKVSSVLFSESKKFDKE